MAKFRFSFAEGIQCLAVVCLHGFIGFIVAGVPSGASRRLVLSILGFLSALVLCGSSIIHLVVFSVLASIAVRKCREPSKSFVPTLSLTFIYLVSFRIWGECAQTHGILMQMALRVISLAVDFRSVERSSSHSSSDSSVLDHIVPDSILKTLGYIWCYVGLLLTPAIRYRTYEHFISGCYQASEKRRRELFCELLRMIAGIIPIAMVLYFSICSEYATTSDFSQRPLWFKLLYIAAMSFSFRCRLQVGIMLGEASAVAAGLGVYPDNIKCEPETGPVRVEERAPVDVDTMTVYSVRPSVEFEVTLSKFVVKWNRTVQSWLVRCFYKQFGGPKQLRLLYVFLMSGLWHGNDISHWLFFLQVALYILLGEAGYSDNHGITPYWAKLLLHNLAFGYWHVPYLILDLSKTWDIYSSLYFCGHFFLLTRVLSIISNNGVPQWAYSSLRIPIARLAGKFSRGWTS